MQRPTFRPGVVVFMRFGELLFFRFFDFGLEVDLVEFEFRLCDGSGRSVYSPSEYVEQIDDRYSVEIFVDDDRFCRVVCGFGCHERFVESASDFGCVGKSDIQVFSAVDCKGCFFGYFTIEYDSGF